jgi:hypothetical protein
MEQHVEAWSAMVSGNGNGNGNGAWSAILKRHSFRCFEV